MNFKRLICLVSIWCWIIMIGIWFFKPKKCYQIRNSLAKLLSQRWYDYIWLTNFLTTHNILFHAICLQRDPSNHTFGLSGYVISWIQLYLTDRSSFVKIDSSSSPSTTILTGMPQGSVHGPLLFVLFISPIANVINSDQSNQNSIVSFHQYADDTQLYTGTNSSTLTSQIASIECCSQRVHDWLLNNGLHLNPSKSEAIAFYNPRSKPLAALAESIGTVSVAGSPIKLQSSIKNLGVYLDSTMSFDKQVSETCKACYFHIRDLISAILSWQAHPFHIWLAFSVSRTLLLGWSHKNLGSATSHLFSLICIGFRFATELALKSLRLLTGCYNFSSHPILLLSSRDMYRRRALRSSSSLSICVPTCKTTMAVSKSFSPVASGIWNALPNHLSSVPTLPAFRRALKHHLFLLAYPDSSAKSGMIKPAQCISLRDTVLTTAITQPVNTMPPI